MRTLSKVLLIGLLGISFAITTQAQEGMWEDLNNQVSRLYRQGRYSEAAKVAEEAFKVTEGTIDPNHHSFATSLIIWP